MVNNTGSGVRIAETTEQIFEYIDKSISINLNGVIYGSKLFGEIMKKQKDAIIINISSACAKHCWSG